ncbi:protein mac-1 [Ditylenchus destructor]|nr:protein mac-1 [Ditylenchus destructor]
MITIFVANPKPGSNSSNFCLRGADLVALVGQAAKFAAQQFEEDGSTNTVTLEHFEKAITEIKPSVDRKHYEEMEKKYAIKVHR